MHHARKHPRNTLSTLLSAAFITSAIGTSTLAQANGLDIRLGNDTVDAQVTIDNSDAKAKFGMGYLYKEDKYSINIANAELHAKGQTAIGNLPTSIGLGIQANYYRQSNYAGFEKFKGSAVALGGNVKINIPETPGLSVEASAHYAPNVLAFDDSDEFRRARFQINYRLIENADVSAGYRYIAAGDEDRYQNRNFESRGFIGLHLKF